MNALTTGLKVRTSSQVVSISLHDEGILHIQNEVNNYTVRSYRDVILVANIVIRRTNTAMSASMHSVCLQCLRSLIISWTDLACCEQPCCLLQPVKYRVYKQQQNG